MKEGELNKMSEPRKLGKIFQRKINTVAENQNRELITSSLKFDRRTRAVRYRAQPIHLEAKTVSLESRANSLSPPSLFISDPGKCVKSPKSHHKQQSMRDKALSRLRRGIKDLAKKTRNRFSNRSSQCNISKRTNRTYSPKNTVVERFRYHYFTQISILTVALILPIILGHANAQATIVDQLAAGSGPIPVNSPAIESESNTQVGASCFGGLLTFEKISMSSFENPTSGSASSSAFGSGILVQQDDQALTSECVNLCRSQANCLSFVIDYNKFECKSYATTQQELQQEFDSKYQASRSVNNNYTTTGNHTIGAQESASTLHFQNLLPSSSSNYFEKVCLDGIANRNQFSDICGQGRLWTIERVVDTFLDGYVEKEVTNVNNKNECSKLCIFETQFVCRSADYDQHSRLCRLSKEDRRTQPQAMRHSPGSDRQYLENQCATPGPSSCVYETKKNLAIISMDSLKFAQTVQDCQMRCNQETTFNCRSYSFNQQRCFLSGDDSASLNNNLIKLPVKQGWQFGEKKCLIDLCTKGLFSYEKITGYTLKSASSMPIDLMAPSGSTLSMVMVGNNFEDLDKLQSESSQSKLKSLLPLYNPRNGQANLANSMMMAVNGSYRDPLDEAASSSRHQRAASNLAITGQCRRSCDLGYLNCPAFTIDYKNNRCQRLDRNSQGRHHELVARDGYAYYEKICLRVPEIMSMCQDKLWIFERVIGYELAPRFYEKNLKFVQSRRDCEEYCLEEKQFQCRSALYNDETSDCKLSRYDRRLALYEGGYHRNFNARVSYLENQCIRDQSIEQKHCYYEQARDESSYPTFTEQIEMVQQSVAPTRIEVESNGARNGSNRYGSSYCEQLCNDNTKFECHSFGFYASTAQCFLSGDDTISAAEMAATPSTGFTYFEKKCRLSPEVTGAGAEVGGNFNLTRDPASSDGSSSTSSTHNSDPYANVPSRTTVSYDGGLSNAVTQKPSRNPYGGSIDPARPTSRPLHNDISSSGPDSIDQFKCGIGHTFVYQRISGFEPIGGYLTLLAKNNNYPGIVDECADSCKKARDCQAFVVDYENNQCYAMLDNSSVGMLNLRQTIGKDYFEGFCLSEHLLTTTAGSCKSKSWVVDRIVDQAVVGVQHQKVITDSDRMHCRQACLEERLFWCKSAMFDSSTNECKLYSIDRETIPQMRLLFSKGIDFYENQCQIVSNACPYDAIERDMTIVTTTKSIQARSTFDCEQACNSEVTFNCRSYTYLDQYPSLPNLCLLSSDSRSTSQKGSVRERPRTLYAERNCYFRRPRYPSGGLGHNPIVSYMQPQSPEAVGSPNPYTQPNQMPPPRLSEQETTPDTSSPTALGHGCEPHKFTFERTFGYDYKLAQKERAAISPTVGVAIGCQQECLKRGNQCQSFVVEYGLPYQSCFLIESQVGANKKLLVKSQNHAYFEKVCLPKTGVDSESLGQMKPPSSTAIDASTTSGYGSEPWSHQVADQLPYYLQQQQQLVQNYPGKSCAKLWTFERFINHNFTAPSDKVLDNVLTRGQCETHCLNEASFSCRAATFDYSNKLCRLFKNTRRTIMSQFFNLEQSRGSDSNSNYSSRDTASNAHPGTAVVLNIAESETLQALNTNALPALDGLRRQGGGRQMHAQPLPTAEPSDPSRNIDYMENTCVAEPSSCQYRQLYDMFSSYIDKINHAVSMSDCQRQCDSERLFTCKSINYDPGTRNCMLINEDLISIDRGQQSSLLPRKNSVYSEKGNCEMISVQCTSQEMLVSINFDSPFRGRLMAKGNPEQCYLIGDGQTSLQFPIVFGPKCNSRQEGHNTFVNEVVIQQHPVIMTDSDKTVRVMCAFEAPDQTITLKNPSSHDNKTGIDVGAPESSRTRHDKQHFNSVVSNKASPPSVLLRILDPNGKDASMINLGDDLILKIQMQTDGQNSALGIFARNLAARSSNGETLLLIDNDGCPIDPQVFPALEVDPKDGKSLYSTFKAFRFPSSGLVNFEVQIKFCPEKCKPSECSKGQARTRSYGRKKRQALDEARGSATPSMPSFNAGRTIVDNLSTVMKPGKALQHVRELMLGSHIAETNPGSAEGESEPNEQFTNPSSSPDSSQEFVHNPSSFTSLNDNSASNPPGNVSGISSDQQKEIVETSIMESPPSDAPDVPEVPFQKSILMHIDEKVVPSNGNYLNSRSINQAHSPMAPYGRLPMPGMEVHRQQDVNIESTLRQPDSNLNGGKSPDDISSEHNDSKPTLTDLPSASTEQLTTSPDEAAISNSAEKTDSETHTKPLQQSSGSIDSSNSTLPRSNPRDVPLRFSILVGENQGLGNNWVPGGPLVMNSTNSVDMDHIVIPGRGGQLEPTATQSDSREQNDSNNLLVSAQNGHSGHNGDVNKLSTSDENIKSNKFYEQTFDALPSNSVAAEVKINSAQGHLDISPGNTNRHSSLSPSASVASHECQESGNNRLRTIIWTGAFVIALNITLVVVSLALYFKRLHLRNHHNISRVFSGLQTTESGRHRRGSVGKNCTSLNAHEHFFYKLNSPNSGGWPNLSSSSSHSTISSMASPLPVTSVKINQSRVLKFPFDSHSSLRHDPNMVHDESSGSSAYRGS